MPGATEYEFWRTIRAEHVPALAAAMGAAAEDLPALIENRFKSDVALQAFAEANGIPTEFHNWIPTNWDDEPMTPRPPRPTGKAMYTERLAEALG
jgi:hypothetical protein